MFEAGFSHLVWVPVLLMLLATSILAFAGIRRVNDAGASNKIMMAPSLFFFLFSIVLILSEQAFVYWLLLLAIAIVVIYALLIDKVKNARNANYILGYAGPVDLSEFASHKTEVRNQARVEPSFAGEQQLLDSANQSESYQDSVAEAPMQQTEQNIQQTLNWISQYRLQLTIVLVSIMVMIVAILTWKFVPADVAEPEPPVIAEIKPEHEYKHHLTMDDDYTLSINTYNGLQLSWQVNHADAGEIWSQHTAFGKASCEQLSFGRGVSFRTLAVKIDNNTYFASFSPLDTNLIVDALADKNRFELCGFDFSLKGSRKQLSEHPRFSEILN